MVNFYLIEFARTPAIYNTTLREGTTGFPPSQEIGQGHLISDHVPLDFAISPDPHANLLYEHSCPILLSRHVVVEDKYYDNLMDAINNFPRKRTLQKVCCKTLPFTRLDNNPSNPVFFNQYDNVHSEIKQTNLVELYILHKNVIVIHAGV